MKTTKPQSVWSNLPDKLIKLSTSLKEYIESDSYLSDDDHMQFQLTSMEIKALKNELHEGVAYSKFVETEDNRQILSQYLQYQLNQIDNLKKDFNLFLNKNNIPSLTYNKNDFFTPTSPNISPPQQSMILSNPSSPFQFDGRMNQKKNFIGSIRFFLSKLQYQKDSYQELYQQKENVNNYLSMNLMKHKSKLPSTTYSLERLCEIVRTSLQELRQQILEVAVDDRNSIQQEQLNSFKKIYNKIKTIPLVQYISKLFKIIKELKTATFQFTKAITAFEKHLSDKKNLQNVQELIEHIEQESDVRFRMRQQSDPTQELTPSKKINVGILTCKTLSKCANENIYSSPNFELSNEQTDDQSSMQDDTSSLFQSQISTSYTDRRITHPPVDQSRIQKDDEKENNRSNQNRNNYNNQKCHSAIIMKTQNNLQYDKKEQAASELHQPLRKSVSNKTSNTTTKDSKFTSETNIKHNDIKLCKTEQSPPEDGTEILSASQKNKRTKSIADEISYRKKKEFSDVKDSLVSNAQSSIIDPEFNPERKYDFITTKKEDDKCMSACNIF